MRCLCLLIVLAAVPSPARADELEIMQAYGPFKAVGIMLETGQALLWDEKKSEYRLARVGDEAYGWKVVAIQREKVVIAQADGGREELVLTPTPTEIKSKKGPKGQRRLPATAVDLEAGKAEAPVPEAKPTARLEPKADPKAEIKLEPKTEARSEASPALAALRGGQTRFTIKRAELDREIADLDRLMAQVTVKPASGGGFVLTRMQNPFIARLGIKEGDIVRTVAGETVSTVEDAARVYARLRTAKTFTVEVERGGTRLALHYNVAG